MKCENCKIDYPSNLVQPFNDSSAPTKFLCGICALIRYNFVHSSNETSFNGEEAERLRKKAIDYRNKRGLK